MNECNQSITIDDLILSRSTEIKKRVEKVICENTNNENLKKDILSELNFFIAYLANEKMPINKKEVTISNSIEKPKLLVYALEYLHNLEEDLKDLNV